MAEDDRKSSTGGGDVPLGKTHELSINIQQAQRVSLKWVGGMRIAIAGIVARLRPGRTPYKRAPFVAVAERAIAGGVDPSLSAFRDRVRRLCELDGITGIPGDTVLEEICKPIYERERFKK
jgi:hypothetical protein